MVTRKDKRSSTTGKDTTKKKLKEKISKGVSKKLKSLVADAIKRHAWNMGVSLYQGNVFYMEKDEGGGEDGYVHGSIVVDRRYLEADLKIYPKAIAKWKEQGDSYIEKLIAHEIAHIVTQNMYEIAISQYKNEGELKDAWESLTETIGRMSVTIDKLSK